MTDDRPALETLPARFDRLQRFALGAAALGGIASILGILVSSPDRFFQAYLHAYLFWLSLSLGSLAWAMLHYLVGGNWGVLIRRVIEAGSMTLPLMALLFIPILLGARSLYPWARPEVVAADAVLQHKSPYLNLPFFIIRAILYFAVWIFLAWKLNRWAHQPQAFTDPVLRRRFQRISAIGILAYVLTMTFAATDWLMSIQPHWYSTIFGLLVITGQALAGLAFAIAALAGLIEDRPLSRFVTPGHLRDLGAFLLTMVIFWAYIAFSQYLIIWAGNLPHEAFWYVERSRGGWTIPILLVLIVQFVLPFFVLLSLRAKRDLRVIAGLSLVILVMRWVENYWNVIPAYYPERLNLHWLDFAAPLAVGGIWLAAFVAYLRRTPTPQPIIAAQHLESVEPGLEHPVRPRP